MGAWGAGSFDNDDALDWCAELEAEGLPAAGGALRAAKELADDYLEAPESSMALAAAEVVAALRGRPAADLPEHVAAWVAAHPDDPGDDLVRLAREAVDAVAAGSELAELWGEVDDAEWRAAVADLRSRLG